MNEDFEIIHSELCVLLKEFDHICRSNNISYSLHGGTLLGAIREHGFIPWDDDIDITLMRSDFNHLIDVLKNKQLKDNFYYIRIGQTQKFILCRPGKPLVWMDLIVYDYITEIQLLQKVKIYGLAFFRALCRETDSLKNTKARGHFKGISFALICFVCYLGKLFPSEFRNKLGDKFSQTLTGKRRLIQRSNDQFVALSMILPKHVMEEYIDIDFLEMKIMISKYYNEILVSSYGNNYLTPIKNEIDVESHKRSSDYIRKLILEKKER